MLRSQEKLGSGVISISIGMPDGASKEIILRYCLARDMVQAGEIWIVCDKVLYEFAM